jgi:hypothetical protein
MMRAAGMTGRLRAGRAGSVYLNSSGAIPKCIPALVRPPSGLMAAR